MKITSFKQLLSENPPSLVGMALISLDFFDTLVHRKQDELVLVEQAFKRFCDTHALKLTTADFFRFREQAYAEVSYANAEKHLTKDRELSLTQWYQKVLELLGLTDFSSMGEELANSVAALEANNLSLTPYADSFLKSLNAAGMRAVVTSDTYYQAHHFQSFFERLKITDLVSNCYLSSEVGMNKASGKLFGHLLEAETLSAEQVLHIGDNEHSDVHQAQRNLLCSLHYAPQFDLEKDTIMLERALHQFGEDVLGPLLGAFCHWLVQQGDGTSELVFLARDSYLLDRIFKQLYPQNTTYYAYINRVVANQLQHAELNVDVVNFINREHRAEGIGGLEKAFGLYDSPFSEALGIFLKQQGVNYSALLEADLVKCVLASQSLVNSFRESLQLRRANTLTYLDRFADRTDKGITFVDIGWRGSIFTMLRAAMPRLRDCLLLCSVVEKQPNVGAAVSSESEQNFVTLLSEYRDLLEWACSEDIGALLYIDEQSSPVHGTGTQNTAWQKTQVQKGVLSFVDKGIHAQAPQTLSEALAGFSQFIHNTPADFVEAMSTVQAELGIDGISGVKFSDMLNAQKSTESQSNQTQELLAKQARVGRFLDLIEVLQGTEQLVLYGAGTGFNFVAPHIRHCASWIIDINTKLHGKSLQGLPIKNVDSLQAVQGTVLVTVIGRKNQIAPLLQGLTCQVLYLEDYL